QLVEREAEWAYHYSPLDILRPSFALEGSTTRDNGRTLSFTSYLINYDAVAPMRKRLVERLIALLEHRSARIASRAAAMIHNALQIPRSDASAGITSAMLGKYHREFRSTLNALQLAVKTGKLRATTVVGVARAVSWHVRHGAPS